MIAVEDRKLADAQVKIPALTLEEYSIVERALSRTAARATIEEYLSFVTRRRRVIDALVKEVYPEWPA